MVATGTRVIYGADAATTNDNWFTQTGTSTGTGTNTSDIVWGTSTGTSAGTWGIAPTIAVQKPLQIPNYNDVPRKHKDKNGCIKKSYWELKEEEPINAADIGGLTFNSSSGANFFMSDTDDDAQGSVRISSASA